MFLKKVQTDVAAAEYHPVRLTIERGVVEARLYPAAGATSALLCVGGAGDGWDTPHDLYPRLCETLPGVGIAALRVRYRRAAYLENCVLDTLAGIAYLEWEGIAHVGLIGWSFGGAVVIQAAAHLPRVRTVVTVATQSYGADIVSDLPPPCSILLLHGTADNTLSPECSEFVYSLAHEPKQLRLFPGANHGLDQARAEVFPLVRDWLTRELSVR